MFFIHCVKFVTIFFIVFEPCRGLQTHLTQNLDTLEKFRQQIVLPVAAAPNCTLNACEALKLVSQLLVLLQTTLIIPVQRAPQISRTNSLSDKEERDSQLHKMVRQIESRLRSVEQPVWRLALGSRLEWNHCTSSACRCNPDTKSFTCWNTNLKSVPVTQVIPMNMVSIDISRNALSTLHKDTFRGLTLLKELDLSSNQLDFLPFDLFQDLDSLIQLRIQYNFLEELDYRIFWKLRHLSLLDLSKNRLTSVDEQLFNHCQRLTVINLADNKIKIFPPNLLRDQSILEELDMSRNELQVLNKGSVLKLDKLIVLDFSSNAIASISEDFFSGLISLRTLILHNNEITTISGTIFKNLGKLITLDLTMNRIVKIHSRAFEELVNLKELFLGQNALNTIPDGMFLNTKSLVRLTFFSNNLTTLESADFEGLTNLKNLMLNNNNLKYVNSKVFAPFKNLEKLRIDSNKLQYLPHGSFVDLQKLISVKLDKNPWHCDCRALYLARWIREHSSKLWDGAPMCRGPGDLGGREVGLLRYDDLCDGQWASMLSLSPRLPVRKNRISTPMNYTDYFNLYLKHIYTSAPDLQEKLDTYLTTERSNVGVGRRS
ncbi:carboxypeptidase N subunit 2 isoform X1 [Lucilia cuprina]|uniref:carboxypeptidase N subunit 2 isoform X1 n=1 Tax=Lucilia cuprina TaxID=7375 RepID=UPI001F061365|nr:carboxypeptidase N subunit 2 isoform X1 [Lucilia cuprina]XP_023305924.2 carboxypeptidase N subunit 2 isoform X1 [Lucilia cuprina]